MGEAEEFNPLTFEKRLAQLKDTQESIQSLSSWCLKQREHHKKIVASWLNVLKRVKVEQRLVLFYLANDVIQYSKRKNYDFVESWGLNLQKATPLVRDEKVRHKILRIFKIWEQRSVYDDEFLSDLTGLLSAGAVKKTDDDPLDFQPQQLVNKIKQCTVLEADTDLRLKYIHESHLQLSDSDALCASLKDRSNKDDVEKELNEGIQCVERYTAALQREIVAREALLALLSTANQYYSTQRGEVKVVAYAYKNFGARVRALKRKLDELTPTLPSAAPSPPERDEDVPSPGPDEDLDLPAGPETPPDEDISYNIDRTFNTSISADGSLYNLGLSSFLTSDNPMALFNDSDNTSANKIEVINSRPSEKQDFDINNFLKTLVSNDSNQPPSDNSNSGSVTVVQKPGESLPGLDLLGDAPLAPDPRPPTSFYGTMNNLNDEPDAYHPEMPTLNQWNNSQWSIPPAPVPPPTVSVPMVPPPSLTIPVSHPSSLPIPVSHPPSLPIPVSHAPMNMVSHSPLSRSPLNLPLNPPLILNSPSRPLNSLLPTPPLLLPAPAPLPPARSRFDTPESPPPAPPPPPAPIVPVYTHNTPELPPADVDHRGILPPPPPPPALPLLGNIEDVDHRLLPPPPPPVTAAQGRHSSGQQDVDHRNLISLTNQPPPPRPPVGTCDQDYRVPPLVPPNDIVESVDMDLSEDEEQQAMFQNEHRRNSFNNNKVLVGGDNGKTNHNENHNLRPINLDREPDRPHPAPVMPPMTNPFDNMPMGLKNINMPFIKSFPPYPREDMPQIEEYHEENSNDSAYEDDLRNRGIDLPRDHSPEFPSPEFPSTELPPPEFPPPEFPPPEFPPPQFPPPEFPPPEFPPPEFHSPEFHSPEFQSPEFENFSDWQQRPFNNQRFPRNWGPRTNFRPPFPQQMWPRNGPRPPNRWMGPRPRFW